MRQRKHTPPRPLSRVENVEAIKKSLKEQFLTWYEQGGALYWAAAKIDRSVETISRWRKEDPAFDEAVLTAYERSTDNLILTAYLRAMKGTSRGADTLMMFLIKERKPSFRENFELNARHLHSGAVGSPTKVPPVVQAAVDAVAISLVTKMAEKL